MSLERGCPGRIEHFGIRAELEHWLPLPALGRKSNRTCPSLSVFICGMGTRIPTPQRAAKVEEDDASEPVDV